MKKPLIAGPGHVYALARMKGELLTLRAIQRQSGIRDDALMDRLACVAALFVDGGYASGENMSYRCACLARDVDLYGMHIDALAWSYWIRSFAEQT